MLPLRAATCHRADTAPGARSHFSLLTRPADCSDSTGHSRLPIAILLEARRAQGRNTNNARAAAIHTARAENASGGAVPARRPICSVCQGRKAARIFVFINSPRDGVSPSASGVFASKSCSLEVKPIGGRRLVHPTDGQGPICTRINALVMQAQLGYTCAAEASPCILFINSAPAGQPHHASRMLASTMHNGHIGERQKYGRHSTLILVKLCR